MRKRKGRSERSENRRKRFIQVFVAMFLVVIMLMSYIAYSFSPDPTKLKYNGYAVRAQVDGNGFVTGYQVKIDGTQYDFYTAPQDSISIAMPPELIYSLREAPLYVVLFNPEDNRTAIYDQLRFEFQEHIAVTQLPALTEPSSLYSFSVLSCSDSSPEVPFIRFSQGNLSIAYEDGCYVFRGTEPYDWALLRDRLLYGYHGVTTE